MVTDRLYFRRWTEEDAEILFAYASDPDIGPICGWRPHKDIDESREIIKTVLSAPEAYAICLKTDNKPIGAIELILNGRFDPIESDDECELGFWLAKPFWGQGIMTEAAKEMLRHAFIDLNMNKVWCAYFDGNNRSASVQKKCGFTYVRTTQDVYVPAFGEYCIGHVNCLKKTDWQKII